jgi:dipeptidyl aminopeptidase/acylaminoacyl peptidase
MNRGLPARRLVGAASVMLALFLATALAPRAFAQRLTLKQVMTFAFPDEITAAAHGERVAWVFNIKGVRNVWVVDGPNFNDPRAVTHYDEDDGRPIASLRLTPNGRTVVYARGSELNEVGQVADPNSLVVRPQQQVWAVDVDSGGEPRLLGTMDCRSEGCEDIEVSPNGQMAAWAARGQIWVAPLSGGFTAQAIGYVRGDNVEPRWSPNSEEIAFQSNRGDHSFIGIYSFASRKITYMRPSFDRDVLPRWSPGGRRIAFIRLPGIENKQPIIPLHVTHWAIWVGNPKTGAAHRIYDQTGNTLNDSYDWLRANVSFHFMAGDRIVFAGNMDGWNHLYSVSANGGTPICLTPGQYEVKDVTVVPGRQWVLYSSNENDIDRRHIWRVNAAGGPPQDLTRGKTIEWFPVETGDGKYNLCLGSSATTPAMPYLITPPGRRIIAGNLIANYPSSELVVPRQVIYKSLDGLPIHGQLFVPRGHIEHAPAIVYMHGGPMRQMMLGFHYMDYYHYAYAENQYLVSLGFVVFSVNYRTGIMYGRAFEQPPHAGWRGASEYQDIVAGAKYLQSLPYVDPNRIGLWGGSYGGYLTALGLARNSNIFKAGVDMHGVHDWSMFLSHWWGLLGRTHTGAPPDIAQAMKLAWESSPDSSIATWKSPVLLIQGDDDRNVPFNQSVDLVQRLRAHHVPFETLVFPDEIHGFLRWKSWMRAYAATANFFVRVLIKGEKISTNN